MITLAPSPTWKVLIKSIIKKDSMADNNLNNAWCRTGDVCELFSRSCFAIKAITIWWMRCNKKKEVCIWIPDYFCNQSLIPIRENNIKIVFYPTTEKLIPDYKQCRELSRLEKPDIFLIVHYFGFPNNVIDADVFCKQNTSMLVEDAAHVLYPIRGVGEKGNFVLYSPHKLLPIPDGSILIMRTESKYIKDIGEEQAKKELTEAKKIVEKSSNKMNIRYWIIKKIIIKLLFDKCLPRKIRDKRKRDILDEAEGNNEIPVAVISSFSDGVIKRMTLKELQEIGNKRIYNYKLLSFIMKEKYGATPLYVNEDIYWIPHMAPFIFEDVIARNMSMLNLNERSIISATWPDLPIETKDDVEGMKQNLIVVAVHQSIKSKYYIKNIIKKKNYKKKERSDINISSCSTKDWKEYFLKSSKGDIIQSFEYGQAKQETGRWKVHRAFITKDNIKLAGFQYLSRKILIFKIIRLNRGPIWLKEITYKQKEEILYYFKKKWSIGHLSILFIAPNIIQNPESIYLMETLGYHYRNSYWSSGVIDLTKSEEELRKGLSSKWRNQLKAAETKGLNIVQDVSEDIFRKMLEIYKDDTNKRKYNGAEEKMINALRDKQALFTLAIMDDLTTIIAFVIVVVHGESSTYYIGWNGEMGRKLNANNLLLWKAMMELKKKGYRYFDLGGIDFENTQGIAEFKMNTGCDVFRLVGEYIGV